MIFSRCFPYLGGSCSLSRRSGERTNWLERETVQVGRILSPGGIVETFRLNIFSAALGRTRKADFHTKSMAPLFALPSNDWEFCFQRPRRRSAPSARIVHLRTVAVTIPSAYPTWISCAVFHGLFLLVSITTIARTAQYPLCSNLSLPFSRRLDPRHPTSSRTASTWLRSGVP